MMALFKRLIVVLLVTVLLVLGCEWGEDDSWDTAAFQCEDPSTSHIEYLGYYGTSSIPEVSGYSNSTIASMRTVREAIDADMEPFLYFGLGYYNHVTNLIDWDMWLNLVEAAQPYLDDIAGFYIMDEPHLAQWYPPNGYDIEDLQILTDLFKEYFPLTPTWINYDWEHTHELIPTNLDYISVTPRYDESTGGVYQVFVNDIKANMHPGQRMLLIGDGYNWDHGMIVPESWQEYKADIARDYLTIASCDESIIGIFTFNYANTTSYSNAYHMPIFQNELESIYNEVFEGE